MTDSPTKNLGPKMLEFTELSSVKDRNTGCSIVHCHGVFDLLHYGHVIHLQSAKSFGDLLVVTITADAYVNKGPGRPYFSAEKRALMLASLECVDYVAISNYPKAIAAIDELKPDYYVKGADYRDKEADRTGGILEEESSVEAGGGKLVFTDDPMESSTRLLNRFFKRWNSDQAKAVETIRDRCTSASVVEIIDQLAGKKVLVVGEPIVDEYIYCRAQNIASKSPIISANHEYGEKYPGGSLAIANHLAGLECQVTLLCPHGSENWLPNFFDRTLSSKIRFEPVEIEEYTTPLKIRYINTGHHEKLFELTHLADNPWNQGSEDNFLDKLKRLSTDQDLVLASDFGHGLFEGNRLQAINALTPFVALGVQSNSANLGYNYFIKHKRYDYLCLDQREYRLALHDRSTPTPQLMEQAANKKFNLPACITMGSAGSMYYDEDGSAYRCPIFFEDIIDTTGAGDAFLALTSLLVQQKVDPILIPFLGNCIAGLKTRIVGNKKPVSKLDLIRAANSILS